MKTATSGARAFIWTPGMVDPSTPVGPGTCCIGEASAINESGQIAGWGYDTASGLAQAYLADGGRRTADGKSFGGDARAGRRAGQRRKWRSALHRWRRRVLHRHLQENP